MTARVIVYVLVRHQDTGGIQRGSTHAVITVQQRERALDVNDILVCIYLSLAFVCLVSFTARLQSFNTPEHQKYTVGQINTYPLGTQAIQVVTSKRTTSIRCRQSRLRSDNMTSSTYMGLVVRRHAAPMATNSSCRRASCCPTIITRHS